MSNAFKESLTIHTYYLFTLQKSSPAGLVLEFEMSVHQKSTTNNLSNFQFKKIKIKKWPHIFFLKMEADFFWL